MFSLIQILETAVARARQFKETVKYSERSEIHIRAGFATKADYDRAVRYFPLSLSMFYYQLSFNITKLLEVHILYVVVY